MIVQVVGSAQLGEIDFAASGIDSNPATIEIAGTGGTEQLSFASGSTISSIATAINAVTAATGVSATVNGTTLKIDSTDYGSNAFVSVILLATFGGAALLSSKLQV